MFPDLKLLMRDPGFLNYHVEITPDLYSANA